MQLHVLMIHFIGSNCMLFAFDDDDDCKDENYDEIQCSTRMTNQCSRLQFKDAVQLCEAGHQEGSMERRIHANFLGLSFNEVESSFAILSCRRARSLTTIIKTAFSSCIERGVNWQWWHLQLPNLIIAISNRSSYTFS